eukprot:TRINITY_DN19036_c0_g1_i1.p1 TRINITY_DN19036_c0_g1~~TRINITY_DN19036_c0_g1_i1.p1  ORF type:complete len:436 (-),score=73.09 TRINITY_DN19036_c0_g1_i1:29-1336(-)
MLAFRGTFIELRDLPDGASRRRSRSAPTTRNLAQRSEEDIFKPYHEAVAILEDKVMAAPHSWHSGFFEHTQFDETVKQNAGIRTAPPGLPAPKTMAFHGGVAEPWSKEVVQMTPSLIASKPSATPTHILEAAAEVFTTEGKPDDGLATVVEQRAARRPIAGLPKPKFRVPHLPEEQAARKFWTSTFQTTQALVPSDSEGSCSATALTMGTEPGRSGANSQMMRSPQQAQEAAGGGGEGGGQERHEQVDDLLEDGDDNDMAPNSPNADLRRSLKGNLDAEVINGSIGHPELCSRPCMFYLSPQGCINGLDCHYCHEKHTIAHRMPEARKVRRKLNALPFDECVSIVYPIMAERFAKAGIYEELASAVAAMASECLGAGIGARAESQVSQKIREAARELPVRSLLATIANHPGGQHIDFVVILKQLRGMWQQARRGA